MESTFAVVVDDEKDARQDVKKAFPKGRLKHCKEFTSSHDFEKGFLSKLRSMKTADLPAVLFIDVRMEKRDSGLVLIREIRRKSRLKRIPIIVISGGDEEEDIYTAYESGANLYLVKSDDPGAFAKAISKIVSVLDKAGRLPADIPDKYGK